MVMSSGLGSPQEERPLFSNMGRSGSPEGAPLRRMPPVYLPHGPQVPTSVGAACPLPTLYTQAPTPFPSVHTETNATLLLGTQACRPQALPDWWPLLPGEDGQVVSQVTGSPLPTLLSRLHIQLPPRCQLSGWVQ